MANLTLKNPLTDIRHEVDRLFENFFPTANGNNPSVWTPAVDVWSTNDHYYFVFDLPGVTKEQVNITFQDGTLQVQGERKSVEEENVHYRRIERPQGHFFRSIQLGTDARTDDIQARFEHGVLTVVVPKVEEVKPRRIDIS